MRLGVVLGGTGTGIRLGVVLGGAGVGTGPGTDPTNGCLAGLGLFALGLSGHVLLLVPGDLQSVQLPPPTIFQYGSMSLCDVCYIYIYKI